jgi:transposase
MKTCPRCGNTKLYKVRRQKLKCSSCKYEWKPDRLPMNLDRKKWRFIAKYFVLGLSSNKVSEQLGVSVNTAAKAMSRLREALAEWKPDIFTGIVEVDETYLGGQWKNKRQVARAEGTKRGKGTSKQPVFGILCREGQVWAEIVPDTKAETLMPIILGKVESGSTVCSDMWTAYTGVASKGFVHRLVDHGKREFSDNRGGHINGLEGFWGYLKRQLASKGGVRRERLHLFLAEYVWKYNHRKEDVKSQILALINIISDVKLKGGLGG